ncbi:MAG: ABC transporter ATP-binding protein [Elusimicrobia bacterium]|nr:ABC transporter ATP-binding protein [Elusimicrobiota bacterium]
MKNSEIISRVYRFVKPHRGRFFAALFSMSLVSALTAAIVYMVKPVMDGIFAAAETVAIPIVGIELSRVNVIYYLANIIIILAVVKGVFEYISNYYMAYIGQNVTKDIRNRLFRHLMYLSLAFYMSNPTGQLLSRITNDVQYLEKSVVKIPAKLIKDGFQLIFLVALIFHMKWKWALFSIIGFFIIVLPFGKFSRMLRKIGKKGHQKMADIYDFLTEKISGVRLIKAFSMEKEEQRKMHSINQKFMDIVLKSERIDAFQSSLTEFLSYSGTAAIVVLGGMAVVTGRESPGTFFAFLAALSGMYLPAKNFAKINQQLQRAMAATERILGVLDHREHILQVENPLNLERFREKIEFEKVGFSYRPEAEVLKDINLTVKRGDIVAFVGPSGAGKTTLVNLVPRFFDPCSGRITIDGMDIREFSLKSLRHKTAIVMQDVILFNVSIRDNICYGQGEFTLEEIEKYALAANAHDFIVKLPDGYDTVVGERGVKLSGGQKQRISIARALIKDPEILILDEATSHLDTESEYLVQEAMDNLMKGRTTFVIAHRLSTVRKADKIIVLNEGRIVEKGTHDELVKMQGLYNKMFEMQSI